jgi:EmrB/QacA subfamily drug resistance transporter
VTAYALTFGGFLLLGGRAADLLGRRRVLMAGLGVFSAASLACALATGDGFLIGARAVQGIGAAVMVPAALSIVMNMFEEGAERNKALGIWGAIAASGATVGLVAGGLLTRYAGWQYIFYLNVPIAVAALSLAPRIVPESRLTTARPRFDALGAVVGTGGIVALVYAISQAPQYGWAAPRTVAVLAAAAALLVAFLVIESRTKDPILPLSIFRVRTLAGANVAGLLVGGSFFAFFFVGTLYMQQVLHYSALQSGVAWLATSITSVALAGLSQSLVTRLGPKVVMAIGMTLIGAGVLWATQVPVHGHYLGNLLGPFAVAGAGTAFAFIPISIAGLAGVQEHRAGLASGLLNTSQQVGGAIGIAIASSIAASHTKALLHTAHTMPSALTGGYQHALWALGAIALLALPAIFALVRRDEFSRAVTKTTSGETEPALAAAD